MSFMTKLPGVPNSDDVKPGMASFEGSGPIGATCEKCVHRGYYRDGKSKFNKCTGMIEQNRVRTLGCKLFLKLTHKHGPAVGKDWKACKFFEAK